MIGRTRRIVVRFLLLWAALLLQPLYGQDAAPEAKADATATAAVRTARLAYFTGDLEVQRTDNTGEDAAVLNMPLAAGTRLITGDYAQAEVEFEDGSVARMTPRTVLSLDALTLEKNVAHTRLAVLGGLAYFELRSTNKTSWSIDAGQALASPTENAVLRVSLDQPPATFAVLSGSVFVCSLGASAKEGGFSTAVHAGESLRADPDDPSRYFLNAEVAQESWDDWNMRRDRDAENEAEARTAARDAYAVNQAYGWSDLDANGNWFSASANPGDLDASAEGAGDEVWQPTAAAMDAGFDPYDDGAFVWTAGSYVWASGYSWGWLPYRCGRWSFYPGLGWVWRPNRFCVVWGFGGYGGVHLGHHPPHYKVVTAPIVGPGRRHPIYPIHHREHHDDKPGEASKEKVGRLDNVVLAPLPRVGAVAAALGSGVEGTGTGQGGSLLRDFPVDRVTHQPVLGSINPPVGVAPDQPVSGWIAHQGGTANPGLLGGNAVRPGGGPGAVSHIIPAIHVPLEQRPGISAVPHNAAPVPAPAPALHPAPSAPSPAPPPSPSKPK